MSQPEYLTVSQLKELGWTDGLIKKHLGDPDKLKRNPVYRSKAPMRLYDVQRVEETERLIDWQALEAKREKRKQAAQKAVETKREQLDRYVARVDIKVPKLRPDKLIDRACVHYNNRARGDEYARPNSDVGFLARITVNYLRHQLTEYEAHLSAIGGKVGARDAYVTIKRKVLAAIADQYPWLEEECLNQVERLEEQEFSALALGY